MLQTGGDRCMHHLAGFLGSLEVASTVLDPPALRAHLGTLANRYAAAAG